MLLGIAGKERSGKKTFFRWLSGTMPSLRPNEPSHLVVELADRRLDSVAEATKATKKTYIKLEFLLPPIKSEGLSPQLNYLRNCDALIFLIRNFKGDIHPPTPLKDLEDLREEMLLTDLMIVEKRIETISMDRKKGKPINKAEHELLVRAKEALEKGSFLKTDPLLKDPPELRGFRFLTQRPLLVLINNSESDELPDIPKDSFPWEFFALRLGLESDMVDLDEKECREFMELYGLSASSKDDFLRKAFDLMELKTFFTYVSGEARAWAVPRGANCLECAGTIHADFKKGFIRAEVVSFQDLTRYKDIQASKKAGVLRLEGKEYMVKDGDVITFRFNV